MSATEQRAWRQSDVTCQDLSTESSDCGLQPPWSRARSTLSGRPAVAGVLVRGQGRELHPPAGAGLGHESLDVLLDRPRGQVQRVGDLTVGESPGEQGQDVRLAPGDAPGGEVRGDRVRAVAR